jgi:cytochrome b6-f complex iron-sulfur subunit
MTEQKDITEKKSRRDFLNYILGFGIFGWLCGIIYPIFAFLEPPKAPEVDAKNLSLGKADDMQPQSSKIFKIGNQTGILIKTSDGEFKAMSATCTHLDCTVQYKKDENYIWCACHNGIYDLNGKNISGPPPAPLTPFIINVKDGEIYVSI